ncbi:unnamed protein product, partial [Polarella glacialis]
MFPVLLDTDTNGCLSSAEVALGMPQQQCPFRPAVPFDVSVVRCVDANEFGYFY